ncbi:MAG: hypothetical protein NTZ73_01715 [Candidatus Diapherotrites archaeon]|nr:hypothetical protein [Candidatus Diapherotrites archaeon]
MRRINSLFGRRKKPLSESVKKAREKRLLERNTPPTKKGGKKPLRESFYRGFTPNNLSAKEQKETERAIKVLERARMKGMKNTVIKTTIGTHVGELYGFWNALLSATTNTSIMRGAGIYFKATIAGGAIGYGIGHAKNVPLVRRATKLVGRALYKEQKKNRDLREFLEKYRYVYINMTGDIVGTRLPKIIFGRMRLRTSKIIAGKY